MHSEDYQQLDGLGIAEGIRQRCFSATEVMDCAIGLAETLNPQLNAVTWETFTQAREEAVKFDNNTQPSTALFAGVPFLIKDIAAVTGLPQTSNSRLFAGEIADSNASIVDAFARSGAVSLGKTNTPELCLTITTESVAAGPCRNPWDLKRSVGGSSGGSAAAVAARIVPIAHATDGGGSIRIPAACCGLVGLKPSRGLTPVDTGLSASWSGMSAGHIVCRTVRDSAAMLDAIRLSSPTLYPLPDSPTSFLKTLATSQTCKIAVQRNHPFGADIHEDVIRALDTTVELLQQLGHQVQDGTPPVDYRQLSGFTSDIINLHVAEAVMPQLEKRGETLDTPLLEEATRRMARRGSELSAMEYVEAIDGIHRIAQTMATFHHDYDILLSPVLTLPAAPLGWLDMNADDMKIYAKRFASYSGFCPLFNATGQPSMSLPVSQNADNLPIGVMISARWGADALLLQLARQLEAELGWDQRMPTLIGNYPATPDKDCM